MRPYPRPDVLWISKTPFRLSHREIREGRSTGPSAPTLTPYVEGWVLPPLNQHRGGFK